MTKLNLVLHTTDNNDLHEDHTTMPLTPKTTEKELNLMMWLAGHPTNKTPRTPPLDYIGNCPPIKNRLDKLPMSGEEQITLAHTTQPFGIADDKLVQIWPIQVVTLTETPATHLSTLIDTDELDDIHRICLGLSQLSLSPPYALTRATMQHCATLGFAMQCINKREWTAVELAAGKNQRSKVNSTEPKKIS